MSTSSAEITEPARATPVIAEFDLCVVGGSCTGVFAAIAAARLGLRVALVETLGLLGGTATASMVCVWHSLWNSTGEQRVTAGLTQRLIDRLMARGAVIEKERNNPHWQYCFNPAEMAIELDTLVEEHGIQVFLHTRVVSVITADAAQRQVSALVIEDKSGRRAIRARAVVDASGDADVLRRLGVKTRQHEHLQPPTTAVAVTGLDAIRAADPTFNLSKEVFDPTRPGSLKRSFLWSAPLPGSEHVSMIFGTRVHGVDCSRAEDLTQAEREGRRQARAIVDLVRERRPGFPVAMVGLPARIGIRESHHAECLHHLTGDELLHGVRFPDAIANSWYRVDIHTQGGGGITFRNLDGSEQVCHDDGTWTVGRWRPEQALDPTFYQIPYRSLVPTALDNVLVAGRCLDADVQANGAVRVMVVCNQMGEAAGTAAALALKGGTTMAQVDPAVLRRTLSEHGAVML